MKVASSQSNKVGAKFPLFLTGAEWIDVLDNELPGDRFFTPEEAGVRAERRSDDDTVKRGMEAFFASDKGTNEAETGIARREMTYANFRKLWRRINSRVKTTLDPALVWLEIKSYIKGSVAALHIEDSDRMQSLQRFLSEDDYLALPRKQSRLDETQRRTVFALYRAYEKLKREGNYFDEMDVIYNLAGRISLLATQDGNSSHGLLPIDSIFVDEVQDFTQAEIFLLTQLSRDPNNLMLAGDTAQSIAVGVGFRFTDVRQIFYHSFGGAEPSLLQLTHNYRSHAGVLRLAACVVELLYFFFGDSLDKLPPDLGLFPGPKPVIMQVSNCVDLVLMLDGSKRETSRIEFGAHQVVIVRSEEAKQSLPEEFGVDKDWVMTVQQSKGLEFDDVLLYNFFTDSEAGDLWRVVSNYTEEDIAAYYADASVTASGVKRFEWETLRRLSETRHLEFSREEHKILESELKMLYTAITRARVNVFIAETDSSASRPMFNYFRCRQVVDTVGNNSDGIAGVRVFGTMNTAEDWRKRGDYYLQKAEGQRRNGCLRLAAKCFDKAGEKKKRDHALAYLSFVQIDEQDNLSSKRQGKRGIDQKQQLYSIAAQLLDARDVGFLDKAGLCLVKTGSQEYARSAEMFELYARISYAQRRIKVGEEKTASRHEQDYFTYSSKMFARCLLQQVNIPQREREGYILGSIRCLLCSGTASSFKQASELLAANLGHLENAFSQVHSLCTAVYLNDPLTHFRKLFSDKHSSCESFRRSVTKLARVTCRARHAANDLTGLSAALEAIPSDEKIKVLSNLDDDVEKYIKKTLWGSSHPCFVTDEKKTAKKEIDVASKIVEQYISEGKRSKAAEYLEERGLLLEAAKCLREAESGSCRAKTLELEAQWLELILQCPEWKQHQHKVMSVLNELESLMNDAPFDVSLSISISRLRVSGNVGDGLSRDFEKCKDSFLWRYECIRAVLQTVGIERLLELCGTNDVLTTARQLSQAVKALSDPSSSTVDDLVSQVESFFHIRTYRYDPDFLCTKLATNLRLREAYRVENESPPFSSSGTLTQNISRCDVHSLLSRYICRRGFQLLVKIDQYLAGACSKARPCPHVMSSSSCKYGDKCKYLHSQLSSATKNYASALQAHLLCSEECNQFSKLGSSLQKRWKSQQYRIDGKSRARTANELLDILLHVRHLEFAVDAKSDGEHTVVWQQTVLDLLASYCRGRWHGLPVYAKEGDVMEAIRFWRTLQFCSSDPKSNGLDHELRRVERRKCGRFYDKKDADCYIKSSIKISKGKLVSVQLMSRMWLWAVDSADTNLFNSITLVERIIKLATRLSGLTQLKKIDQLRLLEVNAVGILSALSLRYSQGTSSGFWLLMPERSYLKYSLLGSGISKGRGFGVPIKETLVSACDKHFFKCFEEVVKHVEWTAGVIVDNGMLSKPSVHDAQDLERFDRAVVLSCFLLCNAIVIHHAGEDMSPREAEDEPNRMPRFPLCGKLCLLTRHLRDAVLRCTVSSRLKHCFGRIDESSTFYHLFQGVGNLLSTSTEDRLVFCRAFQFDNKVDLEIQEEEEDSFVSVLKSTPLDDSQAVFQVSLFSQEEFFIPSGDDDENQDTAIPDDLKEISRKADEQIAALTIQRYLMYWQKTSKPSFGQHFKWWIGVMSRFVLRIESKIQQKKANVPLAADSKESDCRTPQAPTFFPLGDIENLWNDLGRMFELTEKWKAQLNAHAPVFDEVECKFCKIMNNPPVAYQRNIWCQANFPGQPYCIAARHFNRAVLGGDCAPWRNEALLENHAQSEQHKHNMLWYNDHVNEFSRLFARLDISRAMLESVVAVCKEQSKRPGKNLSWYLNAGEDAEDKLSEVHAWHRRLWESGALNWPPLPNTPALVRELTNQSRVPQLFFTAKRDEEAAMLKSDLDDEEEKDEEPEHVAFDDPLAMLAKGTY